MNSERSFISALQWPPVLTRGSKRPSALGMSFRQKRHLKTTALALLVVACAGLFAIATASVVHSIRVAQNRAQLQDLAASTLHRAELGADYAFIALTELMERSDIVCNADTMRMFRTQIHQRAIVKDIRIVGENGTTLCSAFPEALGTSLQALDVPAGLFSRNGRIKLMPLEFEGQSAFGVLWMVDAKTSIMAVVNTGTLVYDVLPDMLREGNEARVLLNDGTVIASHAEDSGGIHQPTEGGGRPLAFHAASKRYPLRAEISVNRDRLSAWNNHSSPVYPAGGGILGVVFGLLAVRAITGPRSVTQAIDRAIAERAFNAYAQPIFSLENGTITGCEILARQVRRDGSVVPAGDFIPLAEQTGRIVPITWQVMDHALARLKPFLKDNKHFTVAFNIDTAHLMQPSFATDLRNHVLGARVSTRQIAIELTERRQISDLDGAAEAIASLKARGYHFSIDDAGTGHSGLSYIQKLGADVIKIDKLFVDSVVDDPSARSLVKMLVRLARELGMSTVAEGIEREDQRRVLAELGVNQGQGFLVSKPLPLDAFLAFMAQQAEPQPASIAA